MLRRIGAGLLGYAVLAIFYVAGTLVAWTVIGEAPFRPDSGDLTTSWMIALLLTSVVGALAGGWMSRRVGGDQQSVAVLITILVGLVLIVVLIDALIGPAPSARAFVEELFGPISRDIPLAELLDGRPQSWFAVASYVVAALAIVAGAVLARKTSASANGSEKS